LPSRSGTDVDHFIQARLASARGLWFRGDRVRACAALLDTGRMRAGTSATCVVSLSKAPYVAVLEMSHDVLKQPNPADLTGACWNEVTRNLRDHLGNADIAPARLSVQARIRNKRDV
jgi:hypothetical protein